MSDKFTFNSAGQVHELEMAMDRVGGWDSRLVKILCMGNTLGLVRDILKGFSTITPIEHLINCDAPPSIPNGWRVEEADQLVNRVRGVFEWDPNKVKLHLSPNQMGGKPIKGEQLQTELANESVLNANILDYLLVHPALIPDEWKGKYVFFWGTVFRSSSGSLCVRCLYFLGGEWLSSCLWLGDVFFGCDSAALRAS